MVGGSTTLANGSSALGAVELQHNDGPWTVPERLRRANAVFTLSGGTVAEGWQASLMHYQARWTGTDQVPQRLIDAGSFNGQPFGRFDSLDPTTGGSTRRSSLSAQWQRQGATGSSKLAAYLIDYRLDLFSNFTYALDRPIAGSTQGDQFAQHDRRRVAGLSASQTLDHQLAGLPARSEFGLQLRHDRVRLGLDDTVARQVVGVTRADRVRQTQLGLYGQTTVELAPWLRGVVGLRADQARFHVDSLTLPVNSGRSRDSQLSPKLSLIAGPWAKTEFFFNAGRGLHSNDARGTTARIDPSDPATLRSTGAGLVASRGWELGLRSEWLPGLNTSLALWTLDFDSELVYVGDAGATEASRPSRRSGRGMEQPLGAAALAAGGRRPGLDACPLPRRRPGGQPHSQQRGQGGLGRRQRQGPGPLVGQPAVALPGQRAAGGGQQRAVTPGVDHQPAHRPPPQPADQRDAGCVQPVQPARERHRILLREPAAR